MIKVGLDTTNFVSLQPCFRCENCEGIEVANLSTNGVFKAYNSRDENINNHSLLKNYTGNLYTKLPVCRKVNDGTIMLYINGDRCSEFKPAQHIAIRLCKNINK